MRVHSAAAVWWHAAGDNGNVVIAYVVQHWRLDDNTWKLKGEDKIADLDEFDRVKTSHSVTGLSNLKKYRFNVSAINAIGRSAESKCSNVIHPDKPLPSPWTAHYNKKRDKMYYHNAIMNRTLWIRPGKVRHTHFIHISSTFHPHF